MSKKNILKENMKRFGTKNLDEGYSWERKDGQPLPTLEDVTKQHQSNLNEQETEYGTLQSPIYADDFYDKEVHYNNGPGRGGWDSLKVIDGIVNRNGEVIITVELSERSKKSGDPTSTFKFNLRELL